MVSALKRFGQLLVQEIKEADTLLRRAGLLPHDIALEANYNRFGAAFGANDVKEFITLAQQLYDEGKDSTNPLYTVVPIDYKRIAIDYNGEKRGIYSTSGKPLAFFQPDFKQLGYATKEEELTAFKRKDSFQNKTNKLYTTGNM